MSFKYFLELYDNWNEIVVVDDNYLQRIAQDKEAIFNVNKRRAAFEKAKVELEAAERELSALLEGGNGNA